MVPTKEFDLSPFPLLVRILERWANEKIGENKFLIKRFACNKLGLAGVINDALSFKNIHSLSC